jgi:lipoprotein Spr
VTTRRHRRLRPALRSIALALLALFLLGGGASAQVHPQPKTQKSAPRKVAPKKPPQRKISPRKPKTRAAVTPKKRKVRTASPARTLAPAVVDSFRTIILTTCPPEGDEPMWKGSMREEMARWLAVRYKRAGITMSGVDCSGFIKTLFWSALSLDLPHSAATQARMGAPVDTGELTFGDLLFFKAKKRISHVGVYIGNGYFIHSSRTYGVRIDSLFGSPYYTKRYARARRLYADNAEQAVGQE